VRTCPVLEIPKDGLRSRGGQPGNTNALKHGFYSPRFKDGEIKSLTLFEEHIDVVSEIKMLRVAVDRVIPRLGEHCDISDCVALLNVLTRAAGRIGHLIRLQKFIYGDQNSVSALLHAALAEIAEEYNLVRDDC
jgi:hypothetical protein